MDAESGTTNARRRGVIVHAPGDAQFLALLEAAPDAMILVDAGGNIVLINSQGEVLFGWRRDEILGQPIEVLIPERFRGGHIARRMDYSNHPQVRPMGAGLALFGLRKDGTEFPVEISLSPIETTEGRLVAAAIRDVTEHKRIERTLHEKNLELESAYRAKDRFLAAIVESSADGIIGKDLNSIVTSWNGGAEAIFGFTADEMVGASIMRLIPADRHGEETHILEKIRRGETLKHFETRRQTKDGRLIDVSVTASPIKDAAGHVVGVSKSVRDITERRRAEAALRESDERTHFALEAGQMGVWEVDLDTRRVTWSPTMEPLFGMAAGEFEGTEAAFLARVHPNDRSELGRAFEEAIRTGRDFTAEFRCVWPAGEVHWHHSRARVMHDADGRSTRMRGVTIDITERRSLEAQFRQAQKMEAIGQLAGGIAHDFNNLLTAILGYSQFLSESIVEGDQARDLKEITKAAQRAAGLTKQLLSFSRQQVLETTLIDANSMIRDLTSMLRRLIGEHIELSMTLKEDLPPVRADKGQLEQVVMNLVLNARDAMPTGGRLEIVTDSVELDEKYLLPRASVKAGGYVMLTVSDSGTGMSEETKAHIFEPFFTTKTRERGTGLGLSTVYGIVSQSGGYVWVYSELGRGTTFKVYLPRADRGQAVQEVVASRRHVPGGTECLLLVEDEEAVRSLARMILERAGYRVLEAANPLEAEAIFTRSEGAVDLLVTDVIMPGGNGTELFRRLSGQRPALRALFMSGYTGDTAFDRGVLGPGVDFLEKPFTSYDLARKVREVIDR